LGNHYVRITVSTGAPTDHGGVPDAARQPASSWTPHDIDQWVRRIGYDFGGERIWFAPQQPRPGEEPPSYGYLTDLVKALVRDLADRALKAIDAGSHGQDGPADAGGKDGDHANDSKRGEAGQASEAEAAVAAAMAATEELDVRQILQSMHVHARVMAVVTELEAVHPGGRTEPVTDPADIPDLVGASTLLTGQRRYPTGLEEWVRAHVPPLVNLLGEDGLAGELVVHNENLTLIFGAFAPNWQLIMYRELVEFADSLAGSYSTWARWLSATAHRTSRELPHTPTEEELDDLLRRSIELVTRQSQVRVLLGYVRSRELLYNSRNRRFLDRLMVSGRLTELEAEVDAALLTVHSHQEWVAALLESSVEQRERREDEERRERDDDRRQREFVFNGVIGLIALLGFFEAFSWLNGERDWTGTNHGAFWVELIFTLVVLVGGAALLLRMHAQNKALGGDDGEVRRRRRGSPAAAARRARRGAAPG
jgi:hypothetical protein